VTPSLNRSAGDRPEPDASMMMLSVLLDGSLSGLATYHLLKADLLTIRGLPQPPLKEPAGRATSGRLHLVAIRAADASRKT
jgi:hypothetical protein